MIDNQEKCSNNGVLGRLVDESGELKEPTHCIIQYGGRVRLPDKLMEILNKEFAPEVMWWQPDGECFAFDSETVQKKILDVWFRGTKLSSFIRSLNRWGFRRVFYHALPETALAFHHTAFRKTSTSEMLKSMKMSKSGKASAAKAEEASPAPSLPKSLLPAAMASPQTANRVSSTSAAAALSPGSILPQLPLSGASARTSLAASVQQQEALLKILSEQRNRDLLALSALSNSSASFPTSLNGIGAAQSSRSDVPSFQLAMLQQQRTRDEEQQNHNLLLIARAEQEIRAQQQQQQQQQQQRRNEAAIRMAILNLKNHHNQTNLL